MKTATAETYSEIRGVFQDKSLEEIVDIFNKVNLEDMREECIKHINVEARKSKSAMREVRAWYLDSIESLIDSLENARSGTFASGRSFPWIANKTMLILVRGALKLDEEMRKRLKKQNAVGFPYDPDEDDELLLWEEEFSTPLMNAFCSWISKTVFLSGGGHFDDLSLNGKEQCFVVLRGALKHERRRYNPEIRELLISIIEVVDHSDEKDLPEELRSTAMKMEKVLTRVFKIIAEVGDKNLLPAVERNVASPDQIRRFVTMKSESNPGMKMEEARWLAINSLNAS